MISTEQGAWCETLFGTEPEQEALGARHALVADHDQVGAALLGDVEDRVRRVALARVGVHLHARLSRPLGRLAQRRVDVLARVDHPLQVLRRLPRLLPQALVRDRLVRGHQLDRRAERLGQLDRLAHRLAGRLGPVGAHHDRLEHAPSFPAHIFVRAMIIPATTKTTITIWV